jgi:hypothetical protein
MATASGVLFGSVDPGAALGGAWRRVLDGLTVLSPGGRQRAERELGSTLARLLEIDLGQLIGDGWRRHHALRAAAERTMADGHVASRPADRSSERDDPRPTGLDGVELVQLAAHQIVTGHRPQLELAVNGAVLATVHFDVEVSFDIDALVATVRRGRLIELQSGRCLVGVRLAAEGQELAHKQATLDLAALVTLGDGLVLVQELSPPVAP